MSRSAGRSPTSPELWAFCVVTYAVSRMGRVRDDYAEMLPDTIVTQGLAIQGETVREARADIRRWLQAIGRV